MRDLIIFLCIFGLCFAAPAQDQHGMEKEETKLLQRPTPINPDVISAPKPNEKITKITDPKEIAKYKRETNNQSQEEKFTFITPTVQPINNADNSNKKDETHHSDNPTQSDLHRQKRDRKAEAVEKEPAHKKPMEKLPEKHIESKHPTQKPAPIHHQKHHDIPAPAQHKKDLPDPLPSKPRQKRQAVNGQSLSNSHVDNVNVAGQEGHAQVLPAHVSANPPTETLIKPQTLPAILPAYDDHSSTIAPQALPAVLLPEVSRPAILIRPDTLPGLSSHDSQANTQLQSSTSAHVDAKRDIPVPLVPKHKHSEESSEESEESDEKHESHKKPEQHDKNPSHENGQVNLNKDNHDSQQQVKQEDQQHIQVIDKKSPPDVVQVEHLSDHHLHNIQQPQQQKPVSQQQYPHVANQKSEQSLKPAENDSSASTTQHPAIRHFPVPVAELFDRPKQTAN